MAPAARQFLLAACPAKGCGSLGEARRGGARHPSWEATDEHLDVNAALRAWCAVVLEGILCWKPYLTLPYLFIQPSNRRGQFYGQKCPARRPTPDMQPRHTIKCYWPEARDLMCPVTMRKCGLVGARYSEHPGGACRGCPLWARGKGVWHLEGSGGSAATPGACFAGLVYTEHVWDRYLPLLSWYSWCT